MTNVDIRSFPRRRESIPMRTLQMFSHFFLFLILLSTATLAGNVENTLAALVEDGTVGDDELILLIESIDDLDPRNPISDRLAKTSIQYQFAQEDLDFVMQSDDVDWDAVRAWANAQLDESKRVDKKRKEKREKTADLVEFNQPQRHLSVSQREACAIAKDRTISCWGEPVANSYMGRDKDPSWRAKTITSGVLHHCIIDVQNEVKCWGRNFHGELDVPEELGEAKAIVAGDRNTCAIRLKDEHVLCWGDDQDPPLKLVLKGLGAVKNLSTDGFSFCALEFNTMITCWDRNGNWKQNSNRQKISEAMDSWPRIKGILLHDDYICGQKLDGALECVYKTYDSYARSILPDEFAIHAVSISGHSSRSCAVLESGEIKCVGDNFDGFLAPPDSFGSAKEVAECARTACVIFKNNTIGCWGAGNPYKDNQWDINPPEGLVSILAREDEPEKQKAFDWSKVWSQLVGFFSSDGEEL